MSTSSTSRIGQEVETYCGRCRMDRTHRVVAQDPDGSISKVICAMCNSYRKYKEPSAAKPRATTRRASTRSVVVEELGPPSRTYNTRENYEVGEVISHPTFGVGKVVSLRDAKKIEVKFSDGVKLLLQNQ